MRHLFVLLFCALSTYSFSQEIECSDKIPCEVQVAYAVSEGEMGEYSITRMEPITKGTVVSYRSQEFVERRIYSRIDHEDMFIVRFHTTGLTHFINAQTTEGFEQFLSGGCTMQDRIYLVNDGTLRIEMVAR